jgi:hypothetical protein
LHFFEAPAVGFKTGASTFSFRLIATEKGLEKRLAKTSNKVYFVVSFQVVVL